MLRRYLLGAFLFLVFVGASANPNSFNLVCNASLPIYPAVPHRRYVLDSPDGAGGEPFCCSKIVAEETVARRLLLLLETLPQSDVECAAEVAAVPRPGWMGILSSQLIFTKAQLCLHRAVRYIWAHRSALICVVKSEIFGLGEPAPLLAFSTVAARSLCDSGAWLDASPPFSDRLEYVFAPNERLSSELLPSAACIKSADYSRILPAENDTSYSVRVQVLATPAADSCRSLFVQGWLARDGDSFSLPAGSPLAISYNRSYAPRCESSLGAVIRLSYHSDAHQVTTSDAHQGATRCRGPSNALIISMSATAAILFIIAVRE